MDEMGQGADALVGQLVAGYRLEAVLGTGLSGAVYLARREAAVTGSDLPEVAAIKVLMPPWQASPVERDDFRERFLREARTLEALRHPHIVPVLRYGRDEQSGLLYMIMPYMPGGTLAHILAPGGLPLDAVASILAQLADALDYAHAQGVIHRDVKPANVLLDAHGQAYLTDFSVARLVQDTRSTQTTTGKVLGTYHYMAPEQAHGERVTAAADQYGLAVLVYQLVTGQVPFDADSLVALALQHVQQDAAPPRTLRPDLPEPTEAAIMRALAKQPSARFPDAATFARAFASGLRGEWTDDLAPGRDYFGSAGMSIGAGSTAGQMPTEQGYTPVPTIMAPRPRNRRRRSGLLVATVASLLAAGVVIASLTSGGTIVAKLLAQRGATSTTSTATPLSTATAMDTLFADSLSANDGQWGGESCPEPELFVNNALEFKGGGSTGPSVDWCVVLGKSFTDMTLRVRMTFRGGEGQVGGGLVYRDNFFFQIYRDGTFAVMDGRPTNSPWISLARGSSASIDTRIGAVNLLSVSIHGTRGDYFVNGQTVAHLDNLPIIPGAIGVSAQQIGARTNISIEDFQDFIVEK